MSPTAVFLIRVVLTVPVAIADPRGLDTARAAVTVHLAHLTVCSKTKSPWSQRHNTFLEPLTQDISNFKHLML